MAQAPVEHLAVALGSAQARPHAPQLVALALRSASQPLLAVSSQSPKPPAHRTTVQAPSLHPGVVTWASAHAAPQPPQCAGSIAVSAQKRIGAAPQVRSGAAQVAPQTPPEQT